jgi:hypothetical protein
VIRSPHRWKYLGWILCAVVLVFGIRKFVDGVDGWNRPINEPSADGAYYYVYLPSLFLDGDLDFSNQYKVTKNWYRLRATPLRKPGNVFGIGPAIFQAPAFLAGHAIAIATDDRRDGFSKWETGLVLSTSLAFSLGAVLLVARLVRRRVGDGPASVIGPLLAMFAGTLWYYSIRQPGYAHPYAAFATAWLIERWDASYDGDVPRSWKTWLHLGVAMGAAMLARPQLVLWGIVLVAAVVDDVRKRGELPWKTLVVRWAIAGVAVVVVFSPQLFAWKALYGSWYTVPQGDGFMRWDDPAWLETLFSSRNGLFAWAPLYLPMLVGLAFTTARLRLASLLLAGFLLQAIVNGAVWDWWAGGSFGGRRFDSAFVVFALGASALLHAGFTLVRAAWRGSWLVRAGAALSVFAMVIALYATRGQYVLARETSVTSARIFGGEAAAATYKRLVHDAPGRLCAKLSNLVTWPARAMFAWRNEVDLGAYDRLVGVHHLGEVFPGLNAFEERTKDMIEFDRMAEPRFRGMKVIAKGTAELVQFRARMFVGLNRDDDLRIRIPVEASGFVRLGWDGEVLVDRVLVGTDVLELVVHAPSRGVHWLEVEAAPGTRLQEPMLIAE